MVWGLWLVAMATADAGYPLVGLRLDLLRFTPDDAKVYVLAHVTATSGEQVPGLFLVDTGSDITVLAPWMADRLGVEGHTPLEVAGLSGAAQAALGTVAAVQFGAAGTPGANPNVAYAAPWILADIDVAIGVPGVRAERDGVPIAGILGADVWAQRCVVIDDRSSELWLGDAGGGCPATVTVRAWAPLTDVRGHLTTPVTLHPRRAPTQTIDLPVDTGARWTWLRGDGFVWTTDHATEGVAPVHGVGPEGRTLRTTRRLHDVRIDAGGAQRRLDTPVRWWPFDRPVGDDALRVRGVLGHGAWAGGRLVLDARRGRMAIVPSPRDPAFHGVHAAALRTLPWADEVQHAQWALAAARHAEGAAQRDHEDEALFALQSAVVSPDLDLAARAARVTTAHGLWKGHFDRGVDLAPGARGRLPAEVFLPFPRASGVADELLADVEAGDLASAVARGAEALRGRPWALHLAWFLSLAGAEADAWSLTEAAMARLHPEDVPLGFSAAIAQRAGHADAARRLARDARTTCRDADRRALCRLWIASLLGRTPPWTARRARRLAPEPGDASGHDTHALWLAAEGRDEQALAWSRAALAADPDDPYLVARLRWLERLGLPRFAASEEP